MGASIRCTPTSAVSQAAAALRHDLKPRFHPMVPLAVPAMATSDAVRFRGRRRALSLRRSRQHARDLPVRTCPVHLHILLRAAAGSMDRRAHWRTYRGPLGRRLAGHGRTPRAASTLLHGRRAVLQCHAPVPVVCNALDRGRFLERVLDGRRHDRCRRCIAAQRASPAAAGRCEPVAMDTYGRSGAEACAGWRPSPQPLGRHCFWFSLICSSIRTST